MACGGFEVLLATVRDMQRVVGTRFNWRLKRIIGEFVSKRE
jgi:hypothetical protein